MGKQVAVLYSEVVSVLNSVFNLRVLFCYRVILLHIEFCLRGTYDTKVFAIFKNYKY